MDVPGSCSAIPRGSVGALGRERSAGGVERVRRKSACVWRRRCSLRLDFQPLTRVLLLTVSCFWLSSPPPGQIQRERRRRLAPSGALFSISLFASSRLKWIRFKAPTMSSSTPKLSFPRLLPNRSVNSAKTTTFPRRPNRRLQQTESWPEALTPSPCDPTCFSVASYDRPFPPPPPSLGPNTPAAESSINPSVTCTLSVPAAD